MPIPEGDEGETRWLRGGRVICKSGRGDSLGRRKAEAGGSRRVGGLDGVVGDVEKKWNGNGG